MGESWLCIRFPLFWWYIMTDSWVRVVMWNFLPRNKMVVSVLLLRSLFNIPLIPVVSVIDNHGVQFAWPQPNWCITWSGPHAVSAVSNNNENSTHIQMVDSLCCELSFWHPVFQCSPSGCKDYRWYWVILTHLRWDGKWRGGTRQRVGSWKEDV